MSANAEARRRGFCCLKCGIILAKHMRAQCDPCKTFGYAPADRQKELTLDRNMGAPAS